MPSRWLIGAGVLLVLSTAKRPTWFGGPERRYTTDDTAYAMLKRSSRASLGGYLILGGATFSVVGF